MDIREAAKLLGGDVVSFDRVACPAPGSPADDRSLIIVFKGFGFRIDGARHVPWQICRDHVRAALGMPPYDPDATNDQASDARVLSHSDDYKKGRLK
jgi:hypothetical protein